MEKRKYNIICFGLLYWTNLWKRNQSMIAKLSEWDLINKVIYINPETWIGELFQKTYTKKTWFSWKKYRNIYVLTFFHIPFLSKFYFCQKLEMILFYKIITLLNNNRPYIFIDNRPNFSWLRIVDHLIENSSLSIFDLSDDFLEFYSSKKENINTEYFLSNYLPKFDIVFAVNENVKIKYSKFNPNIYTIRNAVHFEKFAIQSFRKISNLEKIPKPILGYIGTINSIRIDYKILEILVNQKKFSLVFIGIPDKNFQEWAQNKTNVYILPPVDQKFLPYYIKYFDIAIIPFKINKHTKGNDLLKLYEFLAMSKPIVLTDINEKDRIKHPLIKYSKNPQDFLKNILDIYKKNFILEDQYSLREIAKNNSWDIRIQQVKNIIIKHLQEK